MPGLLPLPCIRGVHCGRLREIGMVYGNTPNYKIKWGFETSDDSMFCPEGKHWNVVSPRPPRTPKSKARRGRLLLQKPRKRGFSFDMHCVYILYSPLNNKFYIGETSNIEERLKQHNRGLNPSTAPFAPWEIRKLLSIIVTSDEI